MVRIGEREEETEEAYEDESDLGKRATEGKFARGRTWQGGSCPRRTIGVNN